jgi:hypothetical protein
MAGIMIDPAAEGHTGSNMQSTTTFPARKMDCPIDPQPPPANTLPPIDVTETGTVIVVSIGVVRNAPAPIVVSCETASNVMVARLRQLANAYSPSTLTEAGISIEVIAALANAPYPMVASEELASNVTVSRPTQFANACVPSDTTAAGISIVVIPEP